MRLSLIVAAVAALVAQTTEADTSDHKYKQNEHIELWVNKVGSLIMNGSWGHFAVAVITAQWMKELMFVSFDVSMVVFVVSGTYLSVVVVVVVVDIMSPLFLL